VAEILVTGGAGYLGSVATTLLLDAGHRVRVLDDLSTGHLDAVDERAQFVEGSLEDPAALDQAVSGVQSVLHFAGKSLVGESVAQPELYHRVNVGGTTQLLEAMARHGVTRCVFSSSAATYGEPVELPLRETSPTQPTSPYGESKLRVDALLSDAATRGLAAVSLRYFNVAGALETARGWLGERHHPETHLIPNVLEASENRPLTLFGTDWNTPDGTCVRDYVHVVDLIDAHVRALDVLESGRHHIVNLGSGRGYSNREVIATSESVLGRPVPVVESPRRPGDPAVLVASIERAEHLLGWRPERDLRRMIDDAYAARLAR
jgi:UDP-glucose 4-epimerase